MARRKIPSLPTIRRLPSYLHIIRQLQAEGIEHISGTVIANELELEPIQVRKDLAVTGIIGKPRIGYPVDELIDAIEHYLQWDMEHKAIVVGVGNLGQALLGYKEFQRHGMKIVAAFDNAPDKISMSYHGVLVYPMVSMESIIQKEKAKMAILTVPSQYAQQTADKLIDAGIKAIWNFTNEKLKVPDDVVVQKEDLSSGYAVLCVKMDRFIPS